MAASLGILELPSQSFCLQLNYSEFCNLMNSRSRRKEEEQKKEEEKEEEEEKKEEKEEGTM